MDISTFHLPRYHELPRVPLYKDQVITYLESVLQPLIVSPSEKIITPTMLNNYVKQKIVSPPKDKKYSQNHLAYLIVVCVLKQTYSLNDICNFINIQIIHSPIEPAYDYFCVEMEQALQATFITRDFSYPSSATATTAQSELLRSIVMSVAHKFFAQHHVVSSDLTL